MTDALSELCIPKHYDLPLYTLSGNILGPLWIFWCMAVPVSLALYSYTVLAMTDALSELCIPKHYDLPLYTLSGNILGPLWIFWCMAVPVSLTLYSYTVLAMTDVSNAIAGAFLSSYLSNKFRSWLTPQQSQFPGLWYTGLDPILHSFLRRSFGPYS